MEGDEASTSTAPDTAPVPAAAAAAAAAPAPMRGGRGGRGGARKAGSAAGRGKKRNSELDGLRDSLSAEPSTSKRPRRGAAPAVLETSTSTSTTTAAIEAADDAEQPGLGNETCATVRVTAGPSKKRVIQTSSEDEDGAPQEGAGKTGFKIKLKKPSVEEPQALEEASAVADQAVQPSTEQSAVQDVDEGAITSVVAAQLVQEDDTQSIKVQQEIPVQPPMQEPSPPSTLATPVIEVAEDSDTGSTSAATNNRKKVPNKSGMAGKARGGPTPSISQQTLPPGSSPMPGSSGLTKKPKQPIKPPGSLKPKAKLAAAAAAPAASANIFDSLFSGIVATTDHEKQLKKDRDERAVAVAKQKEREAQAKKATLSLARVAAAGGTDSGNEGSDSQSVKKQKQPTKVSFGYTDIGVSRLTMETDSHRRHCRVSGNSQAQRSHLAFKTSADYSSGTVGKSTVGSKRLPPLEQKPSASAKRLPKLEGLTFLLKAWRCLHSRLRS